MVKQHIVIRILDRPVGVSYLLDILIINSAPTLLYTLSLHDALPISDLHADDPFVPALDDAALAEAKADGLELADRKSTRLNSSHRCISYAVFCLKKKKDTVNFAYRFSRAILISRLISAALAAAVGLR